MEKYSVDDVSYFNYRSKDDSVFVHYTKTPCAQYTAEEKIRYAKQDFAEAHDRYEVIYLVTGKVSYYVEGVCYSLKNGDVLLIPPGKIHKRSIIPEGDYERYNIQFHRNLISSAPMHLNSIFDDLLNTGKEYLPYLPSDIVKKYGLDKTIRNFIKFQDYKRNKDIVLINYILNLAIEINNIFLSEQLDDNDDLFGAKHQLPLLRAIVDYIDKHLYSKIKLDDIADALYMNKYYISHYFKNKMGSSLKRYISMKKLCYAEFLILNGSAPTAVAMQLGYSNYSTFYYAYKKYFNREPSRLEP